MYRSPQPLPHETPGFEQVVLAVTEQDLGLPALGEEGVRRLLRAVPFEWAFAWTARIDAVIRHGAQHRAAREAQLLAVADVFAGHTKHDELVRLVALEQRSVFSTPYLHAIQRLLVQEARDGDDECPGDRRRMQDVFLGICNVVSPASERPGGFDRSYHLALTVRSGVTNATEPVVEAVTRAYAIYHELPRRRDADQVPNYVPRERWEPERLGALSVHERFMAGMAVMGAVGVFNDELPDRPTGVPSDYFDVLAAELTDGNAERLTAAIAADRHWLRTAFAREQPELRNTSSNSIPFQARPLLSQRGGYLLSSTNALASWMTRGVHYACLTPLEGTPAARAFLTYVGRLFEAYAVELITHAHRNRSEVLVLGERSYDGGSSHTSDIAVAEDSDLVLIEIEARRFSRRALLSPEPKAALDELETMVVSKARQLDRCITALTRDRSRAALPGVDIDRVERIWPVIVIEGAIAHTPLLREYLDDALGDALGQTGIERLSILSMAEFEMICGFIEHGHRLAMTLKRWTRGSRRDSDFTYFCSTKPDLRTSRRASLVSRRWERLTTEVNAAFSAETRARLAVDEAPES